MCKMASKKNKKENSEKELTLEEKIQCEVIVSLADVACPICLCILVEPVSMPCHHVICSPCFQGIKSFLAHLFYFNFFPIFPVRVKISTYLYICRFSSILPLKRNLRFYRVETILYV